MAPTAQDLHYEETSQLIATLQTWSRNTREYDLYSFVETISKPPSALEFSRDYVGRNRPVMIEGAVSGWPALDRWQEDEYLARTLGDAPLTVALTPGGRADALEPAPPGAGAAHVFALPAERRMSATGFLRLLAARSTPVPYMQYQNSSLTVEAPQLLSDVAPELEWASEAFGGPPEAVNLWMGDDRSVTSWHRDHYENMYVVITGVKHFALMPPADSWRMGMRRFSSARWTETASGGGLELKVLDETVLWSTAPAAFKALGPEAACADDAPPMDQGEDTSSGPTTTKTSTAAMFTGATIPRYFSTKDLPGPIHVSVRPGQTLYLPAGWWHCVAQGPRTLAVNYWHDQHWGAAAAAGQAADALAVVAGLADKEP